MRAALQRIRRLNLTDQPYRAPWCVAIDPPVSHDLRIVRPESERRGCPNFQSARRSLITPCRVGSFRAGRRGAL
jgi:hypothetical protein